MFSSWLLYRVLLFSAVATTLLVFWLLSTSHDPLLRLQTGDVNTQRDRSYFPANPELCRNASTAADLCSSFPRDALANVQIVVKTGVGERHSLEALLSSYGSCISNLPIVSDTPDMVQGKHVHDVLGDLPSSYAQNNSDWSVFNGGDLIILGRDIPIADSHASRCLGLVADLLLEQDVSASVVVVQARRGEVRRSLSSRA